MKRLLVSIVFASACGTTIAYSPLQSPPHAVAPRTPDSVAVLQREPDRPYVSIGTIETQPDSGYAEQRLTPKLVGKMREEAARHGCDALLMHDPAPSPGNYGVAGDLDATSYRAGCIVFTGATASR